MKQLRVLSAAVHFGFVLVVLSGSVHLLRAQPGVTFIGRTPINPDLLRVPGAPAVVSNILATPPLPTNLPVIYPGFDAPMGTFWSLQNTDWPPLPFLLFTNVPVYDLDATDGVYVIDDRSVDYADLGQQTEDSNSPTITWPVSLNGLLLVDPTNVPEVGGTFYLYQDQFLTDPPDPPPYPAIPDFAQGAPVYLLDATNGLFLVDDTGITRPEPQIPDDTTSPQVTYPPGALWLQITNVNGGFANLILNGTQPGATYQLMSKQLFSAAWSPEKMIIGAANQTSTPFSIPTRNRNSLFFWAYLKTNLWLEIPADGLASPDQLTVVLHNTSEGQSYTVLTKSALNDPSWTEQPVYGAPGSATTIQLSRAGYSSLFVWARTGAPSSGLAILFQPLDQDVLECDTVTFSVVAAGNGSLSYQWTCNSTNIDGATGSSFTIDGAQMSDAGGYAVTVSSGTNSATSRTAQLRVWPNQNYYYPQYMAVGGPRQDYQFKEGVTYYVGAPVQLYGDTVLRGGTVIKLDWHYTNATLQVMGSLKCETKPYYPAILTSVDDDGPGFPFGLTNYDGPPQPYTGTAPYLDLTASKSDCISNLRIAYADTGVTMPALSQQLDVWDCQFLQCNVAIDNEVPNFGAVSSLHNVLFANCGVAVGASTNSIEIRAEQVTADVTNFWSAPVPPWKVSLTNSIITGTLGSTLLASLQNVATNSPNTIFQAVNAGNYYLPANSPFHQAGNTNISAALLSELRHKTTYPPVSFPTFTSLKGEMTLLPQAPRYTNGAPDIGYYYDVLDYTVADMILEQAKITVLPGVTIGFREEYVPVVDRWTRWGFDLRPGSIFISYGLPTNPNTFVDVQFVQEQFEYPCEASFVPDYYFWSWNDAGAPPPSLAFRFCNFYASPLWYHVWSGYTWSELIDVLWESSPDSPVYWNMQDCALYGGQVNLGPPDENSFSYGTGAVFWKNNLFDHVAIALCPADPDWMIYCGVIDCDVSVQAYNNLFRGSPWFRLEPIPASAGNWVFKDNLFDKVHLEQDPDLPLDFDNNGYWPLLPSEFMWWRDAAQLFPTVTGDGTTNGLHEVVLTNAPRYQAGPYGDYYLPTNTPLYGAGSRGPGDAGLYHYTTRVDQTKEGDEPTNHNVNIGLHYIATTNASSNLPMDLDGDGIPDYVENWHGDGSYSLHTDTETDWQNTQTITGVNDPTNSVYDDIDLSGNGLVGRIKRALGLNPLYPNNPLTLKQVGFDDEWGIATFEVPVSYSTLTNIGSLNLNLNGIDVTLEDFARATNGNTWLNWNTLYEPPGLHYVQAQISLNGTGEDSAILSGVGALVPFDSDNLVQFFETDAIFDDTSVFLDAQLPVQNADYVIRLYDPSTAQPSFLAAITNSTSNSMIQEDWDLTYGGTNVFTGPQIKAVFEVTLSEQSGGALEAQRPSSQQRAKNLNRIATRECVSGNCLDGFDVVYFYTPTNSALTSMFYHGEVWCGMQAVVDILTFPEWPWDVYYSYFNLYGYPTVFAGYPGYVTSRATVTDTLYPDMANGTTKNFYGYGHGGKDYLGTKGREVSITAAEVANALANQYDSSNGLRPTNPYRFVFLDGCLTASGKEWRRAFGIMPIWAANQAARYKLGPQAFVGWSGSKVDYLGGSYTTNGLDINGSKAVAIAYSETLQWFFVDWMNGASLAQCIQSASDTNLVPCPLPVPGNRKFTIHTSSVNYLVDNSTNTSPIYVVGHSGLTVSGLRPQDDKQFVSRIDVP